MTSVAYGFAMPVSRGVLTPPGFPAWLPLIGGGNPPLSYADFAGGRYWCGHSQWLTSEDASAYFSAAGYSFTGATVASPSAFLPHPPSKGISNRAPSIARTSPSQAPPK